MSSERPWRIVLLSMILPATLGLDAIARSLGHETVALLTPRLPDGSPEDMITRCHELLDGAPSHLDICLVPEKSHLVPLLQTYEPDLCLCLGYRWLLPPEVLTIPRLGVLNGHPSLLPLWRGPFPVAWAVREGETEIGLTFHFMDSAFDTGPVLAQGSRPMPTDDYHWPIFQPLFAELSQELLPRALERIAHGDAGDPQPPGDYPYAGCFPAFFSELDLSQPAAVVHRHVASWRFVFMHDGERGPLTTLDGERVRILRTSLIPAPDDSVGSSPALACADGPLWVLESESA
jgi:methionyl-tRNA formyltransferase